MSHCLSSQNRIISGLRLQGPMLQRDILISIRVRMGCKTRVVVLVVKKASRRGLLCILDGLLSVAFVLDKNVQFIRGL